MDNQDRKILNLLQVDATLTIAEIAGQVHMSQNACWRRIKHLEAEGYVRARVALLDPDKINLKTTVFVMLRAAEHNEAWLKQFADGVSQFPEIIDVYRMSGDIDYLLKVRVADIDAYDRLYKRLIRVIQLKDVSSSFAMEEIKSTTVLPLDQMAD